MADTGIRSPRGLWIALLLLAAACAPQPARPVPIPSPPPTLPDPTPKPLPTLKPSPTALFAGLTDWDLLILSDSSNMGVGEAYASRIEADQNVRVRLLDCWVGNLAAGRILDVLQSDESIRPFEPDAECDKPWQELIREAEVMVLFGNPERSAPADGAWDVPEAWGSCVEGTFLGRNADPAAMAAYQEKMKQSCTLETFSTYRAHLGAILDEIGRIRGGNPILLRMTDFYIPVHALWERHGVDEVCTACLSNLAAAIRQVAEERGVTLVSTMDGLNGADHLEDPAIQGYIGPDGIHLSEEGSRFVAGLLQMSGYAVDEP